MKRRIAAIALLLAGCAMPEPIRGKELRDLAFDLSIYAARESGLPPAHSPKIVFVDDVQLLALEKRHPRAEMTDALYDAEEETIYLPATWSGNSVMDRAILVHELVHHLQFSADSIGAFEAHFRRRFPDLPVCVRTIEWEACIVELQYFFEESRTLPPPGESVADMCDEVTAVHSCELPPQ